MTATVSESLTARGESVESRPAGCGLDSRLNDDGVLGAAAGAARSSNQANSLIVCRDQTGEKNQSVTVVSFPYVEPRQSSRSKAPQ